MTLSDLTEKYAQRHFKLSFSELSAVEQDKVYLEIIDSSGRARPSVNAAAARLSRLGRGLLIVTIGIAVYNIATAEDKVRAAEREGAVLGGGFAGGAAGGAVAGLACGPGALFVSRSASLSVELWVPWGQTLHLDGFSDDYRPNHGISGKFTQRRTGSNTPDAAEKPAFQTNHRVTWQNIGSSICC
ncbi:hypothetical protein P4S72_14180 [Vibrio sp. PP-XX7]